MNESKGRDNPPDAKLTTAGTGLVYSWYCMGCHKYRYTLEGRRGHGLRQRCIGCIKAREAA